MKKQVVPRYEDIDTPSDKKTQVPPGCKGTGAPSDMCHIIKSHLGLRTVPTTAAVDQ